MSDADTRPADEQGHLLAAFGIDEHFADGLDVVARFFVGADGHGGGLLPVEHLGDGATVERGFEQLIQLADLHAVCRPVVHRLGAQAAHLLHQQRFDFVGRAQLAAFGLRQPQISIDPEPCEPVPREFGDEYLEGVAFRKRALYRIVKWLRG